VCGDSIVNDGEQCDDGNGVDTDACRNNCTLPICGDGILNQACERCDGSSFPATAPSSHGACRTGITCGEDSCTFCGDGVPNGDEECDDGNAVDTDTCRNNCTPPRECSVRIAKTVAPDDGSGGGTACDGVADGPFVEAVTVDQTTCVVYQICVTNTGLQDLNGNGVKVSDPVLGTVNFDFGTIAVGAPAVCKLAPGVITAPTCTGGNPAGTSCLCSEVAGVNTATITSAICLITQQDACSQSGSDCSDTANVACLGPGSCRMTGGHNYDVVDATFNENGKVYTTGGQIGAPNETGCCDLPPKGKCVDGRCTGGLNGGDSCTSNDQCPNDPGRNSHCPWGDWEHNHHSGPDDTGSVKGGKFAFHSGTAAAPNEAFIKSVLCADPGWCVQARPAPFKQIFWEGTGVFHNAKGPRNQDVPLPIFGNCGAQPVPWSNKVDGTLHYYKAHVSDFGEPAGRFQKPVGACRMDESCASTEPNGAVEINDCELGDVCLIDSVADPVRTALHPLCLAQTCSECPDAYEIEIHCTADPNSPVAYRVSHFIREGNFQLHPPVGDSCNPSCGDGVCDPGATGTAETCESCPSDCCP
jgi:cysteine-rich repeat protein